MDLITAGEVGLCVSYALSVGKGCRRVLHPLSSWCLQLTDLMNFSVRMMALSEANIVAVERIKEYHDIESEVRLLRAFPRPVNRYDI